ncbi:bifunctional hydroxymethylpyrimidine kinase/phosphomethylpyrimidine kinase [bacterium]|nr:bifunctional hydroxymethylpyrimidine kinase/phosphomethylpyrimidine kinase [bacterium]
MSARLFTKVNLVAVIGKDFPKKHIDFLRRKGIALTSLIKEKGRTFRWEGEYKGDLNTALTLNTELGVLSAFRPQIAKHQKNIEYIFLANVDPVIQGHLLDKMRFPKLVGLDSMNFWIKHKKRALVKLLKRVDIYVANDAEARELSHESNLVQAAKRLRSFGPEMIAIKKGEHGVLFYSDKFIFSFPGYPVSKVVDPTGAGDTFAGGFMGYLAKVGKINESSIRKAVAYATVMASFNVEDFGVRRTSRLTMREVNKRLKTFKRFMFF